jgi:hypothetical protein
VNRVGRKHGVPGRDSGRGEGTEWNGSMELLWGEDGHSTLQLGLTTSITVVELELVREGEEEDTVEGLREGEDVVQGSGPSEKIRVREGVARDISAP